MPDSYILKTQTKQDAREVAKQLTAERTGTVKYVYPSLPGPAVTLPNPARLPQPPDLGKLLADRRIVRVSEERIFEMTGVLPSEKTSLDTQTANVGWNLDKIDSRTFESNGVYRYEERASSAPVYVIDTGIEASLSEFGGRVLPGTDITQSGGDGRVDTNNKLGLQRTEQIPLRAAVCCVDQRTFLDHVERKPDVDRTGVGRLFADVLVGNQHRWWNNLDRRRYWCRYARSFNSKENYTLTLRLTVTNDFDEQPSVTWTIPVDTGCGETVCPG